MPKACPIVYYAIVRVREEEGEEDGEREEGEREERGRKEDGEGEPE